LLAIGLRVVWAKARKLVFNYLYQPVTTRVIELTNINITVKSWAASSLYEDMAAVFSIIGPITSIGGYNY
jgi:hypothetical protein